MSLVYNGITVDKVVYNGTEIEKVIYNGTTVFESTYTRSKSLSYQSSYSTIDFYPAPFNKTCYYTIVFSIYNANTGETTTETKTGNIAYGADSVSISAGTGTIYMDGSYYSAAAAVALEYNYLTQSSYPYSKYNMVRVQPISGSANNDKLRIWPSYIEIQVY